METIFLAGLWGPALLAVGLGIFISREHYIKVYRDLERESFAVLLFGMAGIAAGAAQVTAHNVWETLPEIVISLLGWGLLIKAVVFTIMPQIADQRGNWFAANTQMVQASGVAMVIVGAYLSWIAYMV